MQRRLAMTGLGLAFALSGCASDQPPAPPRAQLTMVEQSPPPPAPKPLPPPNPEDMIPPPPFDDPPLVNQELPESAAFASAYMNVGRPRILIFVNRTLEGNLVPVNPDTPDVTVERHVTSSGNPAGDYHSSTDIYLRPGQYDEATAKNLDYEAIENILTDWISTNGRVTVVSPTVARQRLTDQQVKDLQSGRPTVAREVAQQLDAHILIQVQAHPTQQTYEGLKIRLVAEAIDLKHDGASLARAVVDVPPPLDKVQINRYTRFIARKLEDGMIGAWQSFRAPAPASLTPQPQSPPAPSSAAPDRPIWPAQPPAPSSVGVTAAPVMIPPSPPAATTETLPTSAPVAPVDVPTPPPLAAPTTAPATAALPLAPEPSTTPATSGESK